MRCLPAEALAFPSLLCYIVLTAKPKYKPQISDRPTTTLLHKETSLFNTGTGMILIRFSMILNEWRNQFKQNELPSLWTARKQPLQLDRLIPLHNRFEIMSTSARRGRKRRTCPSSTSNCAETFHTTPRISESTI